MVRKPSYKPLLFTTTMRNPERLQGFLGVLAGYDGKVLSNELSREVAGAIIERGLYSPQRIAVGVRQKLAEGAQLSAQEAERILCDNPQNHKEAGFDKGWPSRFDTWFRLAKELGFVFYRMGEPISFSELGLKFAKEPELGFARQAFLNAFAKYQSNNPFRRVLNENVPLVLLLQVIQQLNGDAETGNSGISKLELPLLLYWKNSDATALCQRIKALRHEFGYSPSYEVITDICRDEIMGGTDIKRNDRSIMLDYPDDFIRKMRLTGLISLRGGGRFVDINKNELRKVNYILQNYARYEKFPTEETYFEHISRIDEQLVSVEPQAVSSSQQEQFLQKWVQVYVWQVIKSELQNLSSKRHSRDETLKYLPGPVRLEFLIALAIKSQFPQVRVVPNYPVDDEGLPTSTAPGAGDTGDIECFAGTDGVLVEVTLAEGRTQTVMEVWPIGRHLAKFASNTSSSVCYFVAPSLFHDTLQQIKFLQAENQLTVLPKTIQEFIDHLETATVLHKFA